MQFQIGPRMIKTGMAVFLTLILTQHLGTELVLIPIIAAVLALQPSIIRSWKYLKEVVVSNALAVVFSVTALYIFGSTPFSIGLVVILSIAINLQLKLHRTLNITVLAIVAMMLSSDNEINMIYVIERIELLAMGILCAFVVNVVVAPPNHQKLMYDQIKKASEKTNSLIKLIPEQAYHLKDVKKQIADIDGLISKLKEYHLVIYDERKNSFMRQKNTFLRDIIIYKQMIRVLEKELELIRNLSSNLKKVEDISEKQSILMKRTIQELIRYQETIQLMYQDKVIIEKNIDTESKKTMKISINDLIRELKESEEENWYSIFPIANGVVDLMAETEKLERLVRKKGKKKPKKEWFKKGMEKILS